MKAAIIYWTKSGNTKKVAETIRDSIGSFCDEVDYLRVEDAQNLDYFDYELICLGFPSYQWRPPKQIDDFLVNHRLMGELVVLLLVLSNKYFQHKDNASGDCLLLKNTLTKKELRKEELI